MPRLETLCSICDDLNINITWLVTGKGDMNDVMTIDSERFEKIVTKTEEVISEKQMRGIPALARAKLYTKYYNIDSIEGALKKQRISDDLDLLQAAYSKTSEEYFS